MKDIMLKIVSRQVTNDGTGHIAIAQQMQEAAKLAEADRGQTASKRNVPDKGDR